MEPVQFTEKQILEIKSVLSGVDENLTKIYFGCDSLRMKKNKVWHAKYATVMIIHKNGKNGCRIFRDISWERDYDQNKARPALRLMNEVYKVSELFIQMHPFIKGYDIEVHLDVNPDERFGSSCVAKQAAGYILGVTGIHPKLKPDALAASFGADGIGRGFDLR